MGNRTIIKKVCPTCHARGGGCATCGGSGYLDEYIEDGKYYALCPSCYGGRVYNGQFGCSTCGGSGYKWTYVDEPRSLSTSSSTSDGDGGSCLGIIILGLSIAFLMTVAAFLFFTPLIAFVLVPILLILELSGVWGKDVEGNPLDPKRFFTTVELALLYATCGAFLIWRYGAGSYTGFTEGIGYATWVKEFDLFGPDLMFPSNWVSFAVSSYGNGWQLGLIALLTLFIVKLLLRIPELVKQKREKKQSWEESLSINEQIPQWSSELTDIHLELVKQKMAEDTELLKQPLADLDHSEEIDSPEVELEPRFNVFLISEGSAPKIKLQRVISAISGASAADARYVLKHLPEAILSGTSLKNAEQSLSKLTEIGAVAEIHETSSL